MAENCDQIENSSGEISARLSTNAAALRSLAGDALVVSIIAFLLFFSEARRCIAAADGNIIRNSFFEDGLNNWSGRGCKILVHESIGDGKILPLHGRHFASTSSRSQSWNGIQQDITGRVIRKFAYEVIAVVRIFGNANSAEVMASLWVKGPMEMLASLQVVSSPASKHATLDSLCYVNNNIISNHDFAQGLHSWHLNCCDGFVISGESSFFKGTALSGSNYAVITNRKEVWQGPEQDITRNISPGLHYTVSAYVCVGATQDEPCQVIATLKLEHSDSTSYLFIGRVLASNERWEKLEGSFSLTSMPHRVVFFLEGPPPGHDLLVDSVVVAHSALKMFKKEKRYCADHLTQTTDYLSSRFQCLATSLLSIPNPKIYDNLNQGLSKWSPLGSCTLSISTGCPRVPPPSAKDSIGHHEPLSGRYIVTTNRTETWMGPSQIITDKLVLHVTYQVAAWVRVGTGTKSPQIINLAVGVDDRWVNGGHVQVTDDRWNEIVGSFRLEKQPSKVIVYVQGPSMGVDLMVAGLHIFPVDRKARFDNLKQKTDKVRKRDIILKFPVIDAGNASKTIVKIRQIQNSFPFGSCISRSSIENEELVDFFVKNFNWAVFGNELKWYHTEPEQGRYNYRDADEMLDFCKKHGMYTRGHCIFWEVEDAVQHWVKCLDKNDLMRAVQNRLRSLLSRYKGKFRHYDVNNEMLHGSFYKDRLGENIRIYMFEEARKLDPSATLFVNDYNVEDGCDAKASPEMFIHHILDLQEHGAPVDGIGLQGHINNPVGQIVCAALDKLAILGLPIWFTELDVAASNEHVRAEDLEVMLREAYAHPAVEGIMLWGFWELMCRDNSHLVDAEGDINEAGKRYLALKQEWLTHADGLVDDSGEFKFRGYHGSYSLEVTTPAKRSSHSFVVEKGESPLVLHIKS
ncbi:Putative Pol polyprotein from transposon element Bs1 [Dendrobium catenatum]|uniref:Pol polyprotein from transposon element Bs1 n=1 Tax=Dendrobium catenatum TaxID=906689 RepID=A0A2I0X5C3_9ASPA|nr:Putative Pol polyprotein from transposon element Bs1 [Dendrobium catenatum]